MKPVADRYTKDELIELFKKIIAKDTYHPYKKYAESIANFWKALCTGMDQGCMVVSYRIREDEEQKKQRIRLHIPESVGLIGRIITTLEEINRCDNINDDFKATPDQKEKIGERIKYFNGGETLFDFWDTEHIDLNVKDANAFVKIENYPFDETQDKAFVYPQVIYSERPRLIEKESREGDPLLIEQNHAHWRHFEEWRNEMQYLIFDIEEVVDVRTENSEIVKQKTTAHYLYAKGVSMKLTSMPPGYIMPEADSSATTDEEIELKRAISINIQVPRVNEGGITSAKDGGNKYHFQVWDTKTTKVPFTRIGYVKDPCTNGELFESILYPAKQKFKDLINKKAELDVTIATKGFYKSYQYIPACAYSEPTDGEEQDCCRNGKMSISQTECPSCKGSGKKKLYHTSPQDLITFDLEYHEPAEDEDLIDLSKLHYNVPIDHKIIEMTRDLVKECKEDISKTLFNTNIFNRGEVVAATATEIRAMMAPVNNVLSKLAKAKAKNLRFSIRCIADYMDFVDVDWSRMYPSDFKLETIEELLTMLKMAKDACAPQEVINNINQRIYEKQNKDNQDYLKRVKIKEMYRPFAGYDDADRVSKTSCLPKKDSKWILCLYFEDIFREIDHDKKYAKFYDLEQPKQEVMLEEVIEKYRVRFMENSEQEIEPFGLSDGNSIDEDE